MDTRHAQQARGRVSTHRRQSTLPSWLQKGQLNVVGTLCTTCQPTPPLPGPEPSGDCKHGMRGRRGGRRRGGSKHHQRAVVFGRGRAVSVRCLRGRRHVPEWAAVPWTCACPSAGVRARWRPPDPSKGTLPGCGGGGRGDKSERGRHVDTTAFCSQPASPPHAVSICRGRSRLRGRARGEGVDGSHRVERE